MTARQLLCSCVILGANLSGTVLGLTTLRNGQMILKIGMDGLMPMMVFSGWILKTWGTISLSFKSVPSMTLMKCLAVCFKEKDMWQASTLKNINLSSPFLYLKKVKDNSLEIAVTSIHLSECFWFKLMVLNLQFLSKVVTPSKLEILILFVKICSLANTFSSPKLIGLIQPKPWTMQWLLTDQQN